MVTAKTYGVALAGHPNIGSLLPSVIIQLVIAYVPTNLATTPSPSASLHTCTITDQSSPLPKREPQVITRKVGAVRPSAAEASSEEEQAEEYRGEDDGKEILLI